MIFSKASHRAIQKVSLKFRCCSISVWSSVNPRPTSSNIAVIESSFSHLSLSPEEQLPALLPNTWPPHFSIGHSAFKLMKLLVWQLKFSCWLWRHDWLTLCPVPAVYSGICTAPPRTGGRHVNIPARPRLSMTMWVNWTNVLCAVYKERAQIYVYTCKGTLGCSCASVPPSLFSSDSDLQERRSKRSGCGLMFMIRMWWRNSPVSHHHCALAFWVCDQAVLKTVWPRWKVVPADGYILVELKLR